MYQRLLAASQTLHQYLSTFGVKRLLVEVHSVLLRNTECAKSVFLQSSE
jgi:hypothetical protein